MNISNAEYIVMERNISKGLSHIQASLSKLQEEERKGKKGHDYKRYAKIGVVSVGAGALLAFTGGELCPGVSVMDYFHHLFFCRAGCTCCGCSSTCIWNFNW